jgi:hypothetical protein
MQDTQPHAFPNKGIGLALAESKRFNWLGSEVFKSILLLGMARDGFGVILNDIESKMEQGLAAAKRISTATGRPVIFMAGNVSIEKDVDALVERAVSEFGGLDVVSICYTADENFIEGAIDDSQCRCLHG